MYRLLSSREKKPLPIQYETVSDKCRNQFIALIYCVIRDMRLEGVHEFCDTLRLNMGLSPISPNTFRGWDEVKSIADSLNDEQFKDFIDLLCQMFTDLHNDNRKFYYEEFIEDVDIILKENGLGYKVLDGHLVKYMDSEEYDRILEPTFEILSNEGFEVSREHLLRSFESFKLGNNSGALVDATKALESTIDILADRMKIRIEKKSGMNAKINALIEKGLFSSYNEAFLNALVKLLSEAAARNNEGAHAKTGKHDVDDQVVQYALNQTMSSILFLVRCYTTEMSKPKRSLR
jgi:hypothetical protein